MEHKTDTDSAADALILKLRDILDEARSYIGAPTFSPSMDSEAAVAVDLADQYLAGRASLAASAGSEPVAKERFSEPLSRVIHAGYALANCAFNLAQKPGEVLTPSTANTLSDCRKEWDAACAAFKARPSPPEGMVAEQSLLKVLAAVQRYLPPDGPSAKDTLSEIIAIVDPWPLGPLEKP